MGFVASLTLNCTATFKFQRRVRMQAFNVDLHGQEYFGTFRRSVHPHFLFPTKKNPEYTYVIGSKRRPSLVAFLWRTRVDEKYHYAVYKKVLNKQRRLREASEQVRVCI